MIKSGILSVRGTVSILIDKGEATGIEATPCYGDLNDPGNKREARVFYFHQAFQNYWLGYTERCLHFVQKCFDVYEPEKFEVYVIKFYHGKVPDVHSIHDTIFTPGTNSHATFFLQFRAKFA
jgi:hypothetical protein